MMNIIYNVLQALVPHGFWGYIGVFGTLYSIVRIVFSAKQHMEYATIDITSKIDAYL